VKSNHVLFPLLLLLPLLYLTVLPSAAAPVGGSACLGALAIVINTIPMVHFDEERAAEGVLEPSRGLTIFLGHPDVARAHR